jgi:hypothetical protein
MILFQVNEPDVSAELFENEVLAINLSSGHYHSMRFSAVPFWLMISNGYTTDAAIAEIAKYYGIEESIIKEDFYSFLNELIKSQLLKERNSEMVQEIADFQTFCAGKYEKPLLENYMDMKDLILLDPIHEVDIIGWPNKIKTDKES